MEFYRGSIRSMSSTGSMGYMSYMGYIGYEGAMSYMGSIGSVGPMGSMSSMHPIWLHLVAYIPNLYSTNHVPVRVSTAKNTYKTLRVGYMTKIPRINKMCNV